MSSEAEFHIARFIEAFVVASQYRSGWRNSLLERPDKAAKKLRTAERQLDERACKLVSDPEAELLRVSSRDDVVIFFDGSAPPARLTPQDAINLWRDHVSDAIVSLDAGKQAIFLFHEGWGWLCERRSPV